MIFFSPISDNSADIPNDILEAMIVRNVLFLVAVFSNLLKNRVASFRQFFMTEILHVRRRIIFRKW